MSGNGPAPGQMLKNRSIDEPVFLAITGMLLGISFLSLLGRVWIKYKTFAKLSCDDGFVILAFITSLGSAIAMLATSAEMYQLENVRIGAIYPPPASFMKDTDKYFKGTVAQATLFPLSLWAVKFAFLYFFWTLVNRCQSLRWQWFAVFGFTVSSFIAAYGATDWKCIAGGAEYIFSHCGTESAGKRMKFQMWFVCAIDVCSDMLILSIPFALLWQVKLPMRKMLALGAIFSLVLVTMAIAFVRASMITTYKGQPDNSRTTLWTFVEQTIAIIIVCLGSVRALFTQEQTKRVSGYQFSRNQRNSRASSGKKIKYTIETLVTIDNDPEYTKHWRPTSHLDGRGVTPETSESSPTPDKKVPEMAV